MCAARVLAEHYAKVTVFERDDLPDQPANRSAVPQGKHVHLLMARGAAEFEGLFPGLLDDMVSAGVPILENRPDCISFGAAGHLLGTQPPCATSSRPTCRVDRISNGRSGAAHWRSRTSNWCAGASPNPGSTRSRNA